MPYWGDSSKYEYSVVKDIDLTSHYLLPAPHEAFQGGGDDPGRDC